MSRHDSRKIENVKVMLVKGDSGSTIVSIEKTGTSGLVDTYTITMSDGSKSTFTVSNGKEIVSVEKTGTSGLVDTYTMTFNDESTETFEVINGNGIASIEKTGTQGAVDTYTITLDDGTTYTFTVTNATGTVDSAFSTTSENPVENRVITNKINAMDDNIAGTENGATASQTYVAGEFILRNNQLYKATTAIATGDALTVGVNISACSVGEELQQINADVEQINSDLNDIYGSITSTSSDTYASAFAKLYTLLTSLYSTLSEKRFANIKLRFTDKIVSLEETDGTKFVFKSVTTNNPLNNITINTTLIGSSGASISNTTFNSNGTFGIYNVGSENFHNIKIDII